MASKMLSIRVCSPLKLHHSLTGKCHAICHYSYNLSLVVLKKTLKIVYENLYQIHGESSLQDDG